MGREKKSDYDKRQLKAAPVVPSVFHLFSFRSAMSGSGVKLLFTLNRSPIILCHFNNDWLFFFFFAFFSDPQGGKMEISHFLVLCLNMFLKICCRLQAETYLTLSPFRVLYFYSPFSKLLVKRPFYSLHVCQCLAVIVFTMNSLWYDLFFFHLFYHICKTTSRL